MLDPRGRLLRPSTYRAASPAEVDAPVLVEVGALVRIVAFG